jgi:hypothetical protein
MTGGLFQPVWGQPGLQLDPISKKKNTKRGTITDYTRTPGVSQDYYRHRTSSECGSSISVPSACPSRPSTKLCPQDTLKNIKNIKYFYCLMYLHPFYQLNQLPINCHGFESVLLFTTEESSFLVFLRHWIYFPDGQRKNNVASSFINQRT